MHGLTPIPELTASLECGSGRRGVHRGGLTGGEGEMTVQAAIMAFSQSEKIKSGLIWVSQALEMTNVLPEREKKGGERVVTALVGMIMHEVQLAGSVTGDLKWDEVGKTIDQAMAMIDSGVANESGIHFARALSLVTTVGHRAMSFLKERNML